MTQTDKKTDKAQGAETVSKKERKFTMTLNEMAEVMETKGLKEELQKIAELMEGENLTAHTLLRIAKANLKQLELKIA